ncbi:MAG: antitoxin VbhA family protein [Spirochaetaceae bacterium]|jgi:putative transcriptional regulator|nr:antitoxin VbhA family protein [Spirochaetaceae bacterium]
MYKPIQIDRQNLTIMGIKFSSIEALDSAANAIGSNMFEGFEPTPALIKLYRDYTGGRIREHQLLERLKAVL